MCIRDSLYPAKNGNEKGYINSDTLKLKTKVKEFYKYFKYNNKIVDIDDFTPEYLEIYSKNILKKIKENKGGWEDKVPTGISDMITKKKMFGHK